MKNHFCNLGLIPYFVHSCTTKELGTPNLGTIGRRPSANLQNSNKNAISKIIEVHRKIIELDYHWS